MKETKMLICPECKVSNTARVWDKWTAQQEGFKEEDMLGLSRGDLEEHQEQETEYRCPNCDVEVLGAVLLQGDVEYED